METKKELKEFTKKYIQSFRPEWSERTTEDIADSFVKSDYPLNSVQSKSDALWILDHAFRNEEK